LTEARAATQPEPVQRKYVQVEDGQFTDKEVPLNETLGIERASKDLQRIRDWESQSAAATDLGVIAALTDQVRADQGVQPEAQPQQPVEAQQQQQPTSDEEALRAALERPAVRQALETQLQAVEAQRAQYAAATTQAFELSAAATFSQFEELRGVNIQSLPAVLAAVEKNNPQRALAMVQALTATERLHQQARQASAAQAEIQRAQQAVWMKSEDAKFDAAMANEPKEVYEAVTKAAPRLLKQNFGIEPQQLAAMIDNNPGLRSAEAQAILYAALKSQLAQEGIAERKARPPVPNVQRPGVSRPAPSYSDEEAASALRAFNKDPSPKSAAQYLAAKRLAARK
jgi:hypothetical protein